MSPTRTFLALSSLFFSAFLGFNEAEAARDCGEALAVDQVESSLNDAESALKEGDVPSFRASMDRAVLALHCVNEPISTDLSGLYHRLDAIRLYADAQAVAPARPALWASRVHGPETFPYSTVFPPNHELAVAFQNLPVSGGATRRYSSPRAGQLTIDGHTSGERPTERNTIVQLVDESGAVVWTRPLRPQDPMPHFAGMHRRRDGIRIGGAALGATSVALYGLAWSQRAQIAAGTGGEPLNTLKGPQRSANALSLASGLCFATAVGLVLGTL